MITPKQEELLRHTLGADSRCLKKQWGFRNHFCAEEGHSDFEELKKLEDLEMMKSFGKFDQTYFAATEKGALAIGFKPYQLKKTKLAVINQVKEES